MMLVGVGAAGRLMHRDPERSWSWKVVEMDPDCIWLEEDAELVGAMFLGIRQSLVEFVPCC